MLEHAGRFPGSHHSDKQSSSSQTMTGSDDHITDAVTTDSYPPSISSRTTTIASLSEAASRINAQVPFDDEETKDLLLCILYILKNLDQGKIYYNHIGCFVTIRLIFLEIYLEKP